MKEIIIFTMGSRDLSLLIVVFATGAFGVLYPDVVSFFQPYIQYFLMSQLFFSFLAVDFQAFTDTSWPSLLELGMLTSIKLIVLPTCVYFAFLVTMPAYAVPALLLSGISTGVTAPFFADLLDADMALVLRMVVLSSLLVPISLPCMVKLLVGEAVAVPLDLMVRLLAVVILTPMVAVCIGKRICPQLMTSLAGIRFPVSLTLFGLINLGVFSQYSSFFFQHPAQILIAIVVAYGLSIIYYVAGPLVLPGNPPMRQAGAAISMAIMNNVLVIVFSSRFFGPLAPTLAAMYMFPFFTMIVPTRLVFDRMQLAARRKAEQL